MKYAFVVFVRNKAPWIAECVRSVLAQSYSPMELVFSDQGSEDDTLAIIRKTVNGYNGPNKVRVLKCPDTEPRGMRGLMAHINWLHDRLDADFWMTLSGDDVSYPNRAKRTVETLRELNKVPLFFGTAQHFVEEDWAVHGVTAHPSKSQWIHPVECIQEKVGGSVSGSWSAEALDLFGPLAPHALIDVYLPYCAALLDRFYYLHELHHAYVHRPDTSNTGLQGLMKNCGSAAGEEQIKELIQYQLAANWILMTRVTEALKEQEVGVSEERLDEALLYLYNTLLAQLGGWVEARENLTANRIAPMALPA